MDHNYSFYVFNENQKNSLFRQLSRASQPSGVFWPRFYYSWFYADEKTLYNILSVRQKLGPTLEESEISEYNAIRVSPYIN